MRHSNRRQRVCRIPRQTPNPAVNTDARWRGFSLAGVAGYLTRYASQRLPVCSSAFGSQYGKVDVLTCVLARLLWQRSSFHREFRQLPKLAPHWIRLVLELPQVHWATSHCLSGRPCRTRHPPYDRSVEMQASRDPALVGMGSNSSAGGRVGFDGNYSDSNSVATCRSGRYTSTARATH